jgi:hypothetical protein
MTGVDPKGLQAAHAAYNSAMENPRLIECKTCNGTGQHDQDWCSSCGGGGYDAAEGEDTRPITEAITAYLAAALTPLKGAPVAWRGVVDGRTAFLCRTRDEIDRLASDYNAVIEPLFASQPLAETEEKC